MRCRLRDELDEIRYTDHKGRPKVVRYWVMDVADEGRFEPNDEVDEMRWVDADAAEALLSYPHDAELVRAAKERL